MSRAEELNRRYAASSSLLYQGVELFAVHDTIAEKFDQVIRRIVSLTNAGGEEVWNDLTGAAKTLRWGLMTDPTPIERNGDLRSRIARVRSEAEALRGAVTELQLLDALVQSAEALLSRDSLIGKVLFDSVMEVGVETAVVVAASTRSRDSIGRWLNPFGVRVLTLGELVHTDVPEEIAYFVGPPSFFKSMAVSAPRTPEVTFVTPAWFGDRRIPSSAIAEYAEGRIEVAARIIEIGPRAGNSASTRDEVDSVPELDLLPQPSWGERRHARPTVADDLAARKVLLAGGRAIWLDTDGERIRSFDPVLPSGERVMYSEVSSVSAGTYLVLREGAAERQALYGLAFANIGDQASAVRESQDQWKAALRNRLQSDRAQTLEQALRARGIRAVRQARAWSLPSLIRPQLDRDFELLLGWLDLPKHPFFDNASLLRHEVHRASRELRDRLETAADTADLTGLERVGHMTLDIGDPRFRGLFVARVVAVSPFTDFIARHEARLPFEDRGAQWLE